MLVLQTAVVKQEGLDKLRVAFEALFYGLADVYLDLVVDENKALVEDLLEHR